MRLALLLLLGLSGCDCAPAPELDAGVHDAGIDAGTDAGSRCEDGGGTVIGGGSHFGGTSGDVLVEYYQLCFECPGGLGLSDGGTLRPGDGTVGAACTSGMVTSVQPCRVFCCTCPGDSTKHFWSQACVNGACPDEATSCAAAFDFAASIRRPLCR